MPSLLDLQQAFAASVYQDTAALLPFVRDGAFAAARQVQVYRNNTFASLTEALRIDYPVVHRLVGDGFFRYAAASFIRAHPPRTAYLHAFGAAFGDFLADFEPAKSLAYLPDVARLERAWQEAYHAAEGAPFDLAALAAVPPGQHAALRLRLHPSARLLASEFPILEIWNANQGDLAGEVAIDLDQGGERVLVLRRQQTVEILPLDAGDYALLQACARAQALAVALTDTVHAQSDFDPAEALPRLVQLGAIVGFVAN